MAKETAIVTELEGEYALVRTQRASGCAACSERGLCNSMGGGKDLEFLAANPVQAKQGDTVLLDFKSMRLIQLSFLIYIFPILLLVTGAVIGDHIAPAYGIDRSVGAAIFGFTAFFAAIGLILLVERRAKKLDTYKPVILAVKRSGPLQPPHENCEHAHP
jgi:sigma-E factor negative regulatory protein RseC